VTKDKAHDTILGTTTKVYAVGILYLVIHDIIGITSSRRMYGIPTKTLGRRILRIGLVTLNSQGLDTSRLKTSPEIKEAVTSLSVTSLNQEKLNV